MNLEGGGQEKERPKRAGLFTALVAAGAVFAASEVAQSAETSTQLQKEPTVATNTLEKDIASGESMFSALTPEYVAGEI